MDAEHSGRLGPGRGGQLSHGDTKEERRGPDAEKFVDFTVEVGGR